MLGRRQIGTAGLLIELIAGVSYCTRAANWQPGHLPENLRSRQKINKKGNWGETDLGSQFFIFVKLILEVLLNGGFLLQFTTLEFSAFPQQMCKLQKVYRWMF